MDGITTAATQSAIHVVSTTFDGTRAALSAAIPLARGSGARLILIVPKLVSYAIPLDQHIDSAEFMMRRYRDLVREFDGEAQLRLCVCRRVDDVLCQLLPRHATVVVGGSARAWFPSDEIKLIRRLIKLGHQTVFVPVPNKYGGGQIRTLATSMTMLFCIAALLAMSQIVDAQTSTATDVPHWQLSGFADIGVLGDFDTPSNRLFRNRGTTPRVDELDLNMVGVGVKKAASEAHRWGAELTIHAGRDSEIFGFSATAPNIDGADWLRHLGPTNLSYLAPAREGLALQAGIFSSLIGYDSLYAKDNFAYTRPWGADYTPYLMLGVNASYPFTKSLTGTFAVVNGYWHLANANDVPSFVGQIAVTASNQVNVKQTVLYGPHQSTTSFEFWRVLSDSIVERKSDRVTVAFEYQFGAERVDVLERPRALWMSAQLPLHYVLRKRWSVTFRPEAAWDRDGRWIGAPQSVAALTTTLEYRWPYRETQTIIRIEHRVDNSHGSGGGFFTDIDAVHANGLTPTQNLLTVAAILTFERSPRE